MKKLIAILVVFALVAGSIFAADVGVDVFGNVVLAEGSSAKNAAGDTADATAGGEMTRVRIQASGENEDGTFGGWLRMQGNYHHDGDNPWDPEQFAVAGWGYAWWKPIDQFKFQIGSNGSDNFFGLEGVTTWGFYQVAGDVGIISAGNAWGGSYTGLGANFRQAFYGGFDNGAIFTITPMDALAINIAVPFFGDFNGARGEEVYKHFVAQVAYDIDGIGKAGLTYRGGMNKLSFDLGDPTNPAWEGPSYGGSGSTLFAYFGLTAVENLGVDIGLGFTFPVSEEIDLGPVGKKKVTYNAPLAVGLGLTFNADALGVKARVLATFAGKGDVDISNVDPIEEPLNMLFDIMPYYAIDDSLTVHLSAGIGLAGERKEWKYDGAVVKEKEDSVMAWHVHPYITIKSSWWAPNFYAGFRLESDGSKDEKGDKYVNWSIPLGIAFSF